MLIGNKFGKEAETVRREGLINRWHRVAHAVILFPGIVIAYFLGSKSGDHFSVWTILLLMIALEAASLLFAFLQGKPKPKARGPQISGHEH